MAAERRQAAVHAGVDDRDYLPFPRLCGQALSAASRRLAQSERLLDAPAHLPGLGFGAGFGGMLGTLAAWAICSGGTVGRGGVWFVTGGCGLPAD
ncbi:hypothetical protein [Actinoplanes sp. NPDC089786]|uniref:hypothetical protein n=1 Tax=Actinoplanes sp. NPDC089786 TaxID=3155185 RepID=UPI003427C2C8